MYPYTTPYHRFTLPVPVSSLAKLYVTYVADGTVLFEKTLDDCDAVDDHTVRVHLQQQDTGKISGDGGMVEVQVTLLTADSERMTSRIVRLSSGKILKDGEI